MTPFDRFVGIDWTGARGSRHRSIAVAACGPDDAPALVRPGHVWSRAEVLAYVQGLAHTRTLVGFDFSFGFPHADRAAYFPADAHSPSHARALWAEVDAAAVAGAEPDLGGLSHIALHRQHYWLGAADGPRAPAARLRVVEERQRVTIAGAPSSVFVLLGAAQCGKASLAGMRLLHRLENIPVWPFDNVPDTGALVVEIYCRVFAAWGGVRGKIRDATTLNRALAQLGSPPMAAGPDTFSDHIGDALITAVGLRAAAGRPELWHPPGLAAVRQTEGWTFGIA